MSNLEELERRLQEIEAWQSKTSAKLISIGDWLTRLEENGKQCQKQALKTIELEIEWPEADIGGLHFNRQRTKGVFELKEDGNYYSRDILFCSARDTDDKTGRDLLTEYLDSEDVRHAFSDAIIEAEWYNGDNVRVFLPKENQGSKKFNGVTWPYWLQPRYSGSSGNFCFVYTSGAAYSILSSYVYGCAPAICIMRAEE